MDSARPTVTSAASGQGLYAQPRLPQPSRESQAPSLAAARDISSPVSRGSSTPASHAAVHTCVPHGSSTPAFPTAVPHLRPHDISTPRAPLPPMCVWQ
eukprot:294502-Chlamydomonas_euryale.AAC.1